LHGRVTRYDVGSRLYTAEFDGKDNADPQTYTSYELQKIITKPVVGMKGISFVPYTDMSVFAFRGNNEVKAEIVQVYQKNAKLKWVDDNSLSILCVPYNQIRPVSNNDEVEEQADEVKFLRRCNTGSIFAPYVGCEVMAVYPSMNHPARIISLYSNEADVQYHGCKSVCQVSYARMIPFLDIEIPPAKRRKCDQFHYIPKCNNSQQEY
jgi:hypothetical protein